MPTVAVQMCCQGGAWSTIVSIDGALVAVGLNPNEAGDTLSGGNISGFAVEVEVDYPCPGELESDQFTTVRSRCGCNFAVFGVGSPLVCTGPKGGGGCDDLARFRVSLDCCNPLDGWDGEGPYCVRTAGTEDDPNAVILEESDKCNENIEIVSGPYESIEEAEAECGGEVVPRFNCVLGAGPPNLEIDQVATGFVYPASSGLANTVFFLLSAEELTQYAITWGAQYASGAPGSFPPYVQVNVTALDAAGLSLGAVYSNLGYDQPGLNFPGWPGTCYEFATGDTGGSPTPLETPAGTEYLCVSLSLIIVAPGFDNQAVAYRLFISEGTCP